MLPVDFLILEGDNLQKLFPAASFRVGGKQAFLLASRVAVLLTMWFSSLNVLAYIADGGALPSVVLFAAVLWVRLLDRVFSATALMSQMFGSGNNFFILYESIYLGRSVRHEMTL
jgi:hypothetical protein